MSKNFSYPMILLATLLVLSAGSVLADGQDDIEYDIYQRDSLLYVWVDLSDLISGHEITRLKDGIDLMLDCRLSLSVPRRFWGDSDLRQVRRSLKIAYQQVSESFELTDILHLADPPRPFLSILSLRNHLRDSVEFAIAPVDSLSIEDRYVLSLNITSISLTDLNLAPSTDTSGVASPLTYLFRSFLEATGYGRRDFETKSRPFSLSETNR